MVLWSTIISVSVALLIVLASLRPESVAYAYAHMTVSAGVSIAVALSAIRGVQGLGSSASEMQVSAHLARFMGLIWAWGALSLFATYATGIVSWKEWFAFFMVFAIVGALTFFLSARMSGRAERGESDPALLKTARYMAMAQLAGMVIVMLGLLIDGKMARFLTVQRENWQDWAANNYFFFGALGLAIVSAYGVFGVKRTAVERA
ncbi:MAG: hypothetical protein ACFCUN_07180 [Hyphomicrobiaceae bacterium]